MPNFIAIVKGLFNLFTNNTSINPKNAENGCKKQPSSKLIAMSENKDALTIHRMGAISIRIEAPIICLAEGRSSDSKY